jgi:hypothetical protein
MIFPQVHLQGFPICSYMFLCFFHELPFSMGIWFKRSYYVLKDHRQSSFSIWQCPQGSFSSWTVLTQSSSHFKKDHAIFQNPPQVQADIGGVAPGDSLVRPSVPRPRFPPVAMRSPWYPKWLLVYCWWNHVKSYNIPTYHNLSIYYWYIAVKSRFSEK